MKEISQRYPTIRSPSLIPKTPTCKDFEIRQLIQKYPLSPKKIDDKNDKK